MIKITVDNLHEFYQFDVNRSVIVSGLDPGVKYEFHFTTDNMDSVIVKETTTDDSGNVISKIPNQLLTEPYPIILLIYGSHDGVTKTYYKNSLTPIARPKPDGYILPDDEDDVQTYEVLKADIEALKKAVEDLKNNGGSGGVDYSGEIELLKRQYAELFNFKAEKSDLENYATIEAVNRGDDAVQGNLNQHISEVIDDFRRISDNHSSDIVNVNNKVNELQNQTGDIETALDGIITIQNELIGGGSV
jgi:polyhydroxyalkanoate synthesis regulator phasin